MGLQGDLQEVASGWKNKSIFFKIIGVLTIFLAVSSITSLAEIIIEWKGFIKDGIDFYENYLVDPIKDFWNFFGLNFTNNAINSIVLISLMFSVMLRVHFNEYKEGNLSKKALIVIIILYVVVILFNIFFYNNNSHINNNAFEQNKSVCYVFLVAIIFSFFYPTFRKAMFVPIIAMFIVMILAAINKGLVG